MSKRKIYVVYSRELEDSFNCVDELEVYMSPGETLSAIENSDYELRFKAFDVEVE